MAENAAPRFFSAADGTIATQIGTDSATGTGMVIQADGKIVVSGTAYNSTNFDGALVRYNVDGSLDRSFGTGGKAFVTLSNGLDNLNGIALGADGRIVVVGSSLYTSTFYFAMARLNADGSYDNTFNEDGRKTFSLGSQQAVAYGVAVRADGRIVAVGSSQDNSSDKFATGSIRADGADFDNSFSGDGLVVTDMAASSAPNTNNQANSVAIDAQGRVVVAGYSKVGSDYDFAIVRYTATGLLDSSFDGDGKLTRHFLGSGFDDYAKDLVIQPDGKIVVVGYTDSGTSTNSFAITRMNENGSRDTGFGTPDSATTRNGQVITPIGTSDAKAESVALQADGKILVAG